MRGGGCQQTLRKDAPSLLKCGAPAPESSLPRQLSGKILIIVEGIEKENEHLPISYDKIITSQGFKNGLPAPYDLVSLIFPRKTGIIEFGNPQLWEKIRVRSLSIEKFRLKIILLNFYQRKYLFLAG